ncbi:MAG: TIGR00730 family Rossman fold protein [Candidatus Aminicenantes bacterium]|nr:TIGR00730 family Rossman fold protein [Candidatus Aminicenantes bacterium]
MKRARKAYKNLDFLNSRKARSLRILAEYLEPENRLSEKNIKHTVVFFGSARIKPEKNPDHPQNYYKAAEELAYQLASWSHEIALNGDGFTICTGGGPGIMEAANRGARRAHSFSIGLNISLPHEQAPNDYITPELNFEFHYFFMRKLWFIYQAKAAIFFPGGYGTLDELFETLTLIQTGKMIHKPLPILLYDRHFWEEAINFQKLVDMKLISQEDIKLFHYFETPDEGFEYLKPRLKNLIQNFRI